jgi:hypothetical protein
MLFLKIQVLLSSIWTLDRNVMREGKILPTSLLLLFCLGLLLGEEAYATIQDPNMTRTEPLSGFTPPQGTSSTIPEQTELLQMNAQFAPDGRHPPDTGYYYMTTFGLSLSPNSNLCPSNNCQFGFEVGELSSNTAKAGYVLGGILHVITQQAGGNSTNLYNVRGDLDRIRTLEYPDKVTNMVTGELKIGAGTGSLGG